MNKRTLWLVLLGFAVALACSPALGVLGTRGRPTAPTATAAPPTSRFDATRPPQPTATAAPATTEAPTSTVAPATATPAEPAGTPTLSPKVLEIMERIERDVEDLRGLKPQHPVEKVIITPEELARKVEEEFLADYSPEEAAQDAVELWLFGLADKDIDLFEIHKTMLSEGIAGFYDDEEGKMYVVASSGFPAHARMTYAHEYVHALQDQVWDLDEGLKFNDETCEQDTEYCAGVQGLIEGDATFTEYLWFWEKATEREREAIRRYYERLDMPGWDASPEFLQEDILFPYTTGEEFVIALFQRGGWDAVNAAYENPPVSTEQILHPDRYPDDRPVRLNLPDVAGLLGEGWEPITEQNALGEFWIYLTLAKSETLAWRLPDKEAQRAAAGWGGDVYATYHHPETGAGALLQIFVWDTTDDAQEFTDAFLRYAERRFGPATSSQSGRWVWEDTPWGAVIFATQGADGHIWVIAPDLDTAQRLYQAAR